MLPATEAAFCTNEKKTNFYIWNISEFTTVYSGIFLRP